MSGVILVATSAVVLSGAEAQTVRPWTWTDSQGKTRALAELDRILAENKLWVDSERTRGAHADLTGADLSRAPLSGAALSGAHLVGVNLTGANLTMAHLNGTNLSGADLRWADFNNADLQGANLRGARLTGASLFGAHLNLAAVAAVDLRGVNLRGVELTDTDLRGADLSQTDLTFARMGHAYLKGADLTGADLTDAEMANASIEDTDLEDAKFEPKSLPAITEIAAARNLEFMTYAKNPDRLVQLRKQFQEGGFRTQERRITYALSRRRAQLNGPAERLFQTVAFDLTCQYGMNPGRTLQIWLALFLFCWLTYVAFIHTPGKSGLYRIHKIGEPPPTRELEDQICFQAISSCPPWQYLLRLIRQESRVFFWAGFFSLMSAFNIGFRDINFGRWLRLLPRTEYDLKAKGWARTVAGFQSLLSVYLIGLWILTYFGRPFD